MLNLIVVRLLDHETGEVFMIIGAINKYSATCE